MTQQPWKPLQDEFDAIKAIEKAIERYAQHDDAKEVWKRILAAYEENDLEPPAVRLTKCSDGPCLQLESWEPEEFKPTTTITHDGVTTEVAAFVLYVQSDGTVRWVLPWDGTPLLHAGHQCPDAEIRNIK